MAANREKDKDQKRRGPNNSGPPGDFNVDVGGSGGGGGGGGSDSSGSSGGGSSSSSGGSTSGGGGGTAAPKETKKEKRAKLQTYINALAAIGLPAGPYAKLIKAASKKGLGTSTFLRQVSHSKPFKKKFPGIGEFLAENPSVTSAVGDYMAHSQAYRDAAESLGIDVNLNRKRIALLIKQDVSPEEFSQRLTVLQKLQENQSTIDAFNNALAQFNRPPLDQQGAFQFLMGTADAELYDIYETVQLTQMGLNSADARLLARAIGTPGVAFDASAVVPALAEVRGRIGQELAQAGISETDQVLAILNETPDVNFDSETATRAQRAAEQIRQQIANREARVQSRSNVSPIQDRSGRPLLPGAPQGDLQSIG